MLGRGLRLAIKRTTFSGWHLSGEHAAIFRRVADVYKAPMSVVEKIKDGERLSKEFMENGGCFIIPNKRFKGR